MTVQNRIYRLIFFTFLFLVLPNYASIFKNLKTIKKYIAQLEEYPASDNIRQWHKYMIGKLIGVAEKLLLQEDKESFHKIVVYNLIPRKGSLAKIKVL